MFRMDGQRYAKSEGHKLINIIKHYGLFGWAEAFAIGKNR